MKKKEILEIVYTLNLQGQEIEGPSNLAFYDIVKEQKDYVVRYYGACKVHSSKTLKEAVGYIRNKASHLIGRTSTEMREEWRKKKYASSGL